MDNNQDSLSQLVQVNRKLFRIFNKNKRIIIIEKFISLKKAIDEQAEKSSEYIKKILKKELSD